MSPRRRDDKKNRTNRASKPNQCLPKVLPMTQLPFGSVGQQPSLRLRCFCFWLLIAIGFWGSHRKWPVSSAERPVPRPLWSIGAGTDYANMWTCDRLTSSLMSIFPVSSSRSLPLMLAFVEYGTPNLEPSFKEHAPCCWYRRSRGHVINRPTAKTTSESIGVSYCEGGRKRVEIWRRQRQTWS